MVEAKGRHHRMSHAHPLSTTPAGVEELLIIYSRNRWSPTTGYFLASLRDARAPATSEWSQLSADESIRSRAYFGRNSFRGKACEDDDGHRDNDVDDEKKRMKRPP